MLSVAPFHPEHHRKRWGATTSGREGRTLIVPQRLEAGEHDILEEGGVTPAAPSQEHVFFPGFLSHSCSNWLSTTYLTLLPHVRRGVIMSEEFLQCYLIFFGCKWVFCVFGGLQTCACSLCLFLHSCVGFISSKCNLCT